MNTKVTRLCAAVALVGGALGTTMNANAGCYDVGVKPASDSSLDAVGLLLTGGDSFVSIVGMWHVTVKSIGNADTIGIPDGVVLDDGWQTWHADGTEILNSGRAPATQSWCSGIWKQIGRSTYRLRHFAMTWKENPGALSTPEGPAEVHQTVTIDRTGNHFTGSFIIDQYETGESGTAESGQPVHITGSVTGDRVFVN